MAGMPPEGADAPPPDFPLPDELLPGIPPLGAPLLATLLPPPVLEGGRVELEDDPLEGVDDLEVLDDPDPPPGVAGRMPGAEPGFGALTGGLGNALATAAPAVVERPSLRVG
jgi:hypothetical protein